MKKLGFLMLLMLLAAALLTACGGEEEEEYNYDLEEDYENYEGETEEIEEMESEEIIEEEQTEIEPEPIIIDAAERNRRWTADIEQLRNHVIEWHPLFAGLEEVQMRMQEYADQAWSPPATPTPTAPPGIAGPIIDTAEDEVEEEEEEEIIIEPRYNHGLAQVFDESLDAIIDKLPYLTDLEIMMELFMATNHLSVRLGMGEFWSHLFSYQHPFMFTWFADGWYLQQSHEDFTEFHNQRLVAINGIPMEDILEYFMDFYGLTSTYIARAGFGSVANSLNLLKALGAGDGHTTTYTFEDGREIVATKHDLWDEDLHLVYTRINEDVPLFRQQPTEDAWLVNWQTYLEEHDILYISLSGSNWSSRAPGQVGILAQVDDSLRENEPGAVILDLREARGEYDNNRLAGILRRNVPRDRLFVFVDDSSWLGATTTAAMLHDSATIIGQPTRIDTRPAFYMSFTAWARDRFNIIDLNYSGINIQTPDSYGSSFEGLIEIPEDGVFRPHVLIEYTIDDWINNRDPLLEYVLEQLNHR